MVLWDLPGAWLTCHQLLSNDCNDHNGHLDDKKETSHIDYLFIKPPPNHWSVMYRRHWRLIRSLFKKQRLEQDLDTLYWITPTMVINQAAYDRIYVAVNKTTEIIIFNQLIWDLMRISAQLNPSSGQEVFCLHNVLDVMFYSIQICYCM